MRVNPSIASAVAARSERLAPTAESKPTAGTQHGIVAGGCVHPPPDIFVRADATSKTQGKQLHNIAEGVRSGSITAAEGERLLKQQEAITAAQTKAMADGKVTQAEAREIQRMQMGASLSIFAASNNSERDVLVGSSARTQADQIDQIATGRENGNITNFEASRLLGQQSKIADARETGGKLGSLLVAHQQNQAGKDITHHSRPGTQLPSNLNPLPLPFPRPEFPRPQPLPLPFPRPELPGREPLPLPLPAFRTGVING